MNNKVEHGLVCVLLWIGGDASSLLMRLTWFPAAELSWHRICCDHLSGCPVRFDCVWHQTRIDFTSDYCVSSTWQNGGCVLGTKFEQM